ncbi:MAG: YicC/YloC family endoribonuclease [Acidobacteriaceae bacterium]
MTGFARVSGTTPDHTAFVLTLKSVNHRYLDLQFHLPNGMDALEMQWRTLLKLHLVRGHVDVRLSVQRSNASQGVEWDPAVIQSYIAAFRAAATEHNLAGEPDLNAALRLPGVWSGESNRSEEDPAAVEMAAATCMPAAIAGLNAMRAQEGAALAEELHRTLERLQTQVDELSSLRAGMQQAYTERLDQKMRELLASGPDAPPLDPSRILQEAALLAERSDVEEEMARMRGHIQHFQDTLRQGGEVGKKLDFLLQEMAREANTTLSKTGGIANRSLRITELGLAMKAEIEKAREQVQNIE